MLSTGDRVCDGGLEKYTFRTPMSGIQSVMERGEDLLIPYLVGLYCLSPRPDARDVLSVKIGDGEGVGEAEVELVLRRGHYVLAHLLSEHGGAVTIEENGRVVCSCHPEEMRWIVRSSLPKYGGELCIRSRD